MKVFPCTPFGEGCNLCIEISSARFFFCGRRRQEKATKKKRRGLFRAARRAIAGSALTIRAAQRMTGATKCARDIFKGIAKKRTVAFSIAISNVGSVAFCRTSFLTNAHFMCARYSAVRLYGDEYAIAHSPLILRRRRQEAPK
jgi:hypothetical protein